MTRPGDLLTETLFLPNPDGSGHPGATWTVIDSHDPLGNPFTPTVADLGGGSYLVSYQTAAGDPAGLYYALIQADDPFTQEYEIEWTVDYGVAAAGYPTLAEVRQIIATDLADYRALTATGGSTTTLTDPLELLEYEDTYVGADLVFTGGTSANIAKRCRVTASTMATQTVTFTASYGTTPKSILIDPCGVNSAALTGTGRVYEDQASRTATTFALKVGSTALAASTTYLFAYQVIG